MIILAAYLIGALMFSPLLWRMSGKAAASNEQTGAVPISSRSLRLWFLVLMLAIWPLMVVGRSGGCLQQGRQGPGGLAFPEHSAHRARHECGRVHSAGSRPPDVAQCP